jgi:hypothetical protein
MDVVGRDRTAHRLTGFAGQFDFVGDAQRGVKRSRGGIVGKPFLLAGFAGLGAKHIELVIVLGATR